MKLSRQKLRSLILNEIRKINEDTETFVGTGGLLHQGHPEAVNNAARNVIRSNGKGSDAELLVKILDGFKTKDHAKYRELLAKGDVSKGYKMALQAAGRKFEPKLKPVELREIIRSLGVKSGVTAIAKNAVDGATGIIIYGLSKEDMAQKENLIKKLGLKEYKGEAAIKTWKHTSAIKQIADDKVLYAGDPKGLRAFIRSHKGSIFLY